MITIVYLIFSLVIVGCSHQEQPHNSILNHAEQILVEHPDSVVTMLEPYWTDTTLSNPDRALFGLLYTEALHRNGLVTESTQPIQFSREYYERNNDKPRLARALLHHAIVLFHKQQTHEAVLTMKRAEQIALKVNDPVFNCYLYSVLGDINDNVGNNIAQTFDMLGETDSLHYYNNLAKPYAPKTYGEIRATYLTNVASYLLHHNKRKDAKQLLLKILQESPNDRASKLLADVYLAERDTFSAAEQWYQLINSFSPDVSISSYRQLIKYLTNRGDTERAAYFSSCLNDVYHDLYQRSDVASIIDLQAQFDEQQKERQQYRTTIILLSVILMLIIVTIVGIWYSRRRIDRLNARFVESQKKYDRTREELTQMRLQREREERENSEQLKTIVASLHASANKGRAASDEDMNALAQCSYALSPNLQLLFSPLNTKEQSICLLIRHNFQPTEIATLTISTPQTITNTRVRLLKKLFNETGGAKDFDTKLRAFE